MSCLISLSLGTISTSFFSTKTEKKLSSKISALKTELDLCWAEMEVERQTHQRKEKALHAQVIEVEVQRDVAV
jgi:hypothetical protein